MSDTPRNPLLIDGAVGQIELLIDYPDGPPKGLVLVSHPQPLLGGSPRHIVPLTLARQLRAAGWQVVRPSFRGVGQTQGTHDQGIGEAEDCITVIRHVNQQQPELPVALVGFSFGAYVFARVACALEGQLQAVALLGLPVGMYREGAITSHCRCLGIACYCRVNRMKWHRWPTCCNGLALNNGQCRYTPVPITFSKAAWGVPRSR